MPSRGFTAVATPSWTPNDGLNLSPCDLTATVTNEIIFNGSLVEHYAKDRVKLAVNDFEVVVMQGTNKMVFKYSLVVLLAELYYQNPVDLTMSHIICYLHYNRDHFNLRGAGINQIRLLHLGKPYSIEDVYLQRIDKINLRAWNTIHLTIVPNKIKLYTHFNMEAYFRYGTQRSPKLFSSKDTIPGRDEADANRMRCRKLIQMISKIFN